MELGEWERALAVAPGVGLPYWHALAGRYAAKLQEEQREEAVPFLVATGGLRLPPVLPFVLPLPLVLSPG